MSNITDHATLLAAVREEMADSSLPTERINRAIAAVEDDLNANADFLPRFLVSRITATMTANDSYLGLPADFKHWSKIILTGTSPQGVLRFLPENQFDLAHADASATGQPLHFTIIGDEFKFGDKPDSAYALEVTYYAKIQTSGPTSKPDEQKPLTSSNANWIISNHPMIYFHGVITDMLPYVGQKQRARLAGSPQRYDRAVNGLIGIKPALQGQALYSQPVTPTP